MPNFCAVVGCGKRGNRDSNKFFRIPCIPKRGSRFYIELKTTRRLKWILALRRADLTEKKLKYAVICDRHFISGSPAKTEDIYDPDWVPSLNMGYTTENSEKARISPYVEYLRNSIVDQKEANHSQYKSSPDTVAIESVPGKNKASLTVETAHDHDRNDTKICKNVITPRLTKANSVVQLIILRKNTASSVSGGQNNLYQS